MQPMSVSSEKAPPAPAPHPALVALSAVLFAAALGFAVAWGVQYSRFDDSPATCPSSAPGLMPVYVNVTSRGSSAFAIFPPSSLPIEVSFLNGNDEPVPPAAFIMAHDALLHVVVIGSDMSTFAHVHPEEVSNFSASNISTASYFSVELPLEESGTYVLGIDGEVSVPPAAATAAGEFGVSKRLWISVTGGATALPPPSWLPRRPPPPPSPPR
jgi:hypothetical protein